VEEALQRNGGYVLDFKAFSDLSLNLLVESSGSGAEERLEGTVQLTFPDGDGALAHPQPAVPG
jgi:hypothetical protein